MKSFSEEMAFYSAYHQEPRNIAIHIFGVPLITFSLFVVLSWIPLFALGEIEISFAVVFLLGTIIYYFLLDSLLASIAAVFFGLLLYAAQMVAGLSTQTGWIVFAGGQLLGWGTQFYGHYIFEKKRPALFDNLFQALFSAPFFVVADVCFKFGIKLNLEREVKEILSAQGKLRK